MGDLAEQLIGVLQSTSFKKIKKLGSGVAFHYTPHGGAIVAYGRFKGAPINSNLDRTQLSLASPTATDEHGVIFAYERVKDACEEGFGPKIEIFKIDYRRAVSAIHEQEAAQMDESKTGLDCTLRTVLILADDIETFERLGPVSIVQAKLKP